VKEEAHKRSLGTQEIGFLFFYFNYMDERWIHMKKKFLITENNKLANITAAKDYKEAIVDHAVANRINPIVLDAKEVEGMSIKELFVQEAVKNKLNKTHPFHKEDDVLGAVEQVLVDSEIWYVLDDSIEDHVFAYMEPEQL
jgi:hypothetical protein